MAGRAARAHEAELQRALAGRASRISRGACPGTQRDLQDAFPLGAEEIERLMDVVEAEAMRDQKG